ncbi:MAG: FtsW/RodA/SpoVE family cell cycle protein, partial [Bacteroidales bacterium]|nr:FtsW/RodA/SpoVE family cell cycle protein [Bacteroidales bacterium]
MPEETPSTQATKLHYGIYVCYAFLSLISLCASYSLTGKILTSIINVLVGLGVMILFSKISYKFINKFSTIALLLSFVLLVITLIFGSGGGGRSLSIGGAKIQTLYIVTIVVVFYISAFLARLPRKYARIDKKAKIKNLSNKECELEKEQTANQLYFTVMLVLGIFIGMIAMRNISTAILLTITGLSILFITNVKFKYIIFFVLVMGVLGGLYLTYDTLHDRAKQNTEMADKEV